MRKIYLLLLFTATCLSVSFAQTEPLTKKDKATLDSMMNNDEFLKLMKEGKSKNYFDIGIGLGNGAFSSENQAVNATSIVNQSIFTPSVVYNFKNGFSIGVTGFFTNDSTGNLKYYQTGLSAAYEYFGNQVQTGISYTRYLSDNKKYNSKSLYQNDIYGYIKKVKGIIQPGLALGFSTGNYKEVNLALIRRPLLGDTLIRDSTSNKASYFSVSAVAGHDFNFYTLFSKKDGLEFVPSFVINWGSDKITQTHTNKIFNRAVFSNRKRVDATNKFQLQSVGTSLDLTYSIGKLYFQSNFYLDYYLPSTTENRFTPIYFFTAGVSF